MLRPVIGASRAIGTTLLGVGNQIDRGGVRRMEDVSFSPENVLFVCDWFGVLTIFCRSTSDVEILGGGGEGF
jgi:hypothetical protein